MRQAQITLFIILGLVLLLATAIGLWLITAAEQGDTDVRRSTIRSEVIKPVQKYVTDCLEIVSAQALRTLADQGGIITQSQGGVSPDFLPSEETTRHILTDNGDNITYLITTTPSFNLALGTAPFVSNSPTLEHQSQLVYPYMSFPFNPVQPVPQFAMSGLFGWNRINALERTNASESWQETLESYVTNGMARCVNWELLAGTRRITAPDAPSVSVSFGQSDTTFGMQWPIVATELATGATATIKDFSITQPVRLASVHQAVRAMIDKDASESLYNLKAQQGVSIEYVTRAGRSQGSIVRFTDIQSALGDEKYVFTFARQNRPPALLAINQTLLDEPAQWLQDCRDAVIGFSQGTRACPDTEARLGSESCQIPSGPAGNCTETTSLRCRGVALANDLGTDRTGFDLTIRGGMHGDDEPCGLNIALPMFAIDPDEQPVSFQFDFPSVASGYRVTQTDLALPCVGVKAVASDGTAKDWQVARIWTSSRNEGGCSFFTIN